MNKHDKKWNVQYEKLVELKRKTGHCMVPRNYKQDKSLGIWVNKQRCFHTTNRIRLDRKGLLDDIGFVWTVSHHNYDDKLWHQQYEKLVEYKRSNGNCMVPKSYEQDNSLGSWVSTQRSFNNKNKIRLDRKTLLDEIGFSWTFYTLAALSCPINVRGIVIGSFHVLGRSCFPLLTLVFFLLNLCRI
jgi:hypothetical protein